VPPWSQQSNRQTDPGVREMADAFHEDRLADRFQAIGISALKMSFGSQPTPRDVQCSVVSAISRVLQHEQRAILALTAAQEIVS
jgi:hypothetical protein